MSNKRIGCLVIGLFLLLSLSAFLNLVLIAVSSGGIKQVRKRSFTQQFEERLVENGSSSSKIALITLRGIISSNASGSLGESMVDDLKIALAQASDDNEVKAIVLQIDSPGGEVTASDVIYNAVCKARSRKPVVVYMGSVAASGGFYVACGGSYLMANDTTITGSIGVIIQTLNYQQLLGKIGIEAVVFKSGQFKDILSGARQMTPEEKEYIQNLVMQTYNKFVGIVATERKLPVDQLRKGIADGRIISGADALHEKLINQLGLIEDAYAKAKQLGHASGASIIRYEAPFRFGKLARLFGQSESAKVEISLADPILPKLEAGRLYLLPGFFAP